MAITIGVCTSAFERNIGGLLSKLRSTLPMINFRMVSLPYNDLDNYPLEQERLDGLILCHSIQNRRLAITDVLDAIYDKYLPRAKKHLGKENVVVIAHDFSWPFQKKATMETFRMNQPTAVKCSSLVLLSGSLDNTVQMDSDDWNQLTAFAREVKPLESSPLKSAFDVVINWFQSAMSLVIFVIFVIMCIFMTILVIVSSIGLFPLIIIVAVFLSYWFWKIKNKQHNIGIREGDGSLHDIKSHGPTLEVRKKGYRK
ncbi:uncharacterized protein LOC105441932 [Strongylocentrotus purpuratus]|uniref:Uncharacterized protein n=1 Tax=Strongylocentrotus purpuratus TaxID=7668 RepID=A0A7M7PPQ3_STRPU|nr:uncharacterized protein LOC105441932 [Strongylocentrotus purpuratus]|eukprot:XP_011671884.1 PREDICTED: uncharacterized protein LOC105441932 [Strongylocentrotus purpuratus]